jgi:hypothetical protein
MPRADRRAVSGPDVLAKLAVLPISAWSYEWEPDVPHLGPMAQDFAAAFGLGDDETKINHIDANGVTMVAIQALYRRVVELEAKVGEVASQLDE